MVNKSNYFYTTGKKQKNKKMMYVLKLDNIEVKRLFEFKRSHSN